MKASRYPLVPRVLHWLMAAIIIPAWMLGFVAGRILPASASGSRHLLLGVHREIASSIVILIVLRLAWRATHRPPALPDCVPEDQRVAARALQCVMYLLMLTTPLTGWLMSSAYGKTVPVLWVGHLPALIGSSELAAPVIGVAHQFSAWALGVLMFGHIIAALLHRFGRRDSVLDMML
ncbi:cytochrome b [Gluconobacter wancherniae]|uniref:cytochrome b n=1 Tax=Gluconobacter wancherniae TaxID=1307955 RepID=UPI0020110AE0|nr:cytochrome b [Gluconobacter wancherniae]